MIVLRVAASVVGERSGAVHQKEEQKKKTLAGLELHASAEAI